MHILCNFINNALLKKFFYVDIPFKFKYFQILCLLKDLNCINNFYIFENSIRIFLRYFNNKPVFFLKLLLKSSSMKFISYRKINSLCSKDNISIFFTNQGVLSNEKIS